MRKNILWLAVTLLVSACASQQLNFNALDIASSSGRLIKEQILLNLSIFKSDPYPPIVSQVSIPSGSVTTTNQASATITPPFGVAATTSLVNSAVAPLFNATTHTTLTPNGTIGLTGSDQWSQNLSINTITESGPQHRLAALYRYATGETNDAQFMCDYFLVQKQQGSGGASSQTTVNVSIANGQTHYSAPKAADSIHYTTLIPCDGIGKPDPSFLTPPDCVICDYNNSTDASPHQLQLNKRLATGWLIFYPDRDHPESLPPSEAEATLLGHYGAYDIFLKSDKNSHKAFSDFVLFTQEAIKLSTSPSAPSGTTKAMLPAAAAVQLQ